LTPLERRDIDRKDIMEARPGEMAFDINARVFLDAKTFGHTEERTWIDMAIDLDRYCRDGHTLKRMVIRSHKEVVPVILTEPLRIPD
jgi:hypothetical protein